MTLSYIITQALGILGIAASIIAFQCKRHKPLMLAKTTNEFLFALQYGMLGAYTGMAMNLIGCVRNLIFAKQVERGRDTKPLCIVFSAAFLLFVLLTWSGIKSIFIGIAKIVSTIAYGSSNTGFVRLLILGTSVIWFCYNFAVKSYAGCVCEAMTIGSIIVGIIRIDLAKKPKTEN